MRRKKKKINQMIWCACLVLFTQQSVYLVSEKNSFSFPGGKVDPGDISPKETAIREFCEEVYALPKHSHRCQIFETCPSEIITKLRFNRFRAIIRKSQPIGKKGITKDTVYYCLKISSALAQTLSGKMYECPIDQFINTAMRPRESAILKEKIYAELLKQ